MKISALTSTQVWASSARSLTNFGSGALASTSNTRQTLATSASVDLRPSAGTLGMVTAQVTTGAAATAACTISVIDGVNGGQVAATAAAASSNAGFTLVNTPAVGLQVHNNDAVNTGFYFTAGWVYTI